MRRLLLLLYLPLAGISQKTYFGEEEVKWNTNKVPVIPTSFQNGNSDLQVLEEHTEFYFFATNNEKIVRNVVYKVNSQKGAEILSSVKLPESFDPAFDGALFKQGRQSRVQLPITDDFLVKKFAARKYSSNRWSAVSFTHHYDRVRLISRTGPFVNDEYSEFKLQGIKKGDIVEIYYEATFNSNYGTNLFYLSSPWPKALCEYSFIYRVPRQYESYSFLLTMNMPDSVKKKEVNTFSDYIQCTETIRMKGLPGINYFANSRAGSTLPHVFIDFTYYRIVSNSYPTGAGRIYDYLLIRPKNFEWLIINDTMNNYTKIYDKHFSTLRKFVTALPKPGSDSANKVFLSALCDTFNNFRFITANHLYYNESSLYDLYSSDHLMKRRIVDFSLGKLYRDILNDSKIFYYDVNVQDKRLGEHSTTMRAHYAYERRIIALPNKNSFIYFVPRTNGVKYHLGELPFYFESSLGALQPRNFQADTKDKESQYYKFIKTHKGTFNENTRTENATIRVSLDSNKAEINGKEVLTGQFSTTLRHLYLNECIDSTISPYYFRKCTDKPGSSGVKIKPATKSAEYPFRYSFSCSSRLKLSTSSSISLNKWFSFPLSSSTLPEAPTHDYYIDFPFSDAYNFLLDLNAPAEVTNAAEFTRSVSNDLFELKSEIVKNSTTSYLVKVLLVVKEQKISLQNAPMLMDLVKNLDELNNFTLSLTK
jgi:hypothetical protein